MLPIIQEGIFLADLPADLVIRPRLHEINETPQDKQLIQAYSPVPIFTDSDNVVAKPTDLRYNPTRSRRLRRHPKAPSRHAFDPDHFQRS